MHSNNFYSDDELSQFGFKSLGENVLISKLCQIFNPIDIEIGSDVRIDSFCILSGKISLGNKIHIGAYCALYGKYGIEMANYSGLSPRCTLFSATDDFSGDFLISPMNAPEVTNVMGGKVFLGRFTQIGAGTILMPNVIIQEGAVIGAMSFVKKSVPEWTIYAGNPLRYIKDRKRGLLNKLLDNEAKS